jgi:hypothetical protein
MNRKGRAKKGDVGSKEKKEKKVDTSEFIEAISYLLFYRLIFLELFFTSKHKKSVRLVGGKGDRK